MMLKRKTKDLKEIVRWLRDGNIVCTQTDTVIAFVALSEDILYEIKKRNRNKKLIRFVRFLSILDILDPMQRRFMSEFWPGGTTIIRDKIAYRSSRTFLIRHLLHDVKMLYSTSANISGTPLHYSLEEVYEVFKDNDKIMYVDDRYIINTSMPSTIVDVDEWIILRRGNTANEVDEFLKRHIYKDE